MVVYSTDTCTVASFWGVNSTGGTAEQALSAIAHHLKEKRMAGSYWPAHIYFTDVEPETSGSLGHHHYNDSCMDDLINRVVMQGLGRFTVSPRAVGEQSASNIRVAVLTLHKPAWEAMLSAASEAGAERPPGIEAATWDSVVPRVREAIRRRERNRRDW